MREKVREKREKERRDRKREEREREKRENEGDVWMSRCVWWQRKTDLLLHTHTLTHTASSSHTLFHSLCASLLRDESAAHSDRVTHMDIVYDK